MIGILDVIKEKIMIEPEFFLWVIYFVSADFLPYMLILKVVLENCSKIVGILLLLAILGLRLFIELLFRKYSWSGLNEYDLVLLGYSFVFALVCLKHSGR